MCLYCDSKENEHFICECCGAGMCDDCFDMLVEHDAHYQDILENCDSDEEIRIITEACKGEPAYICESCVQRLLGGQKDDNKPD